MFEKYFKRRYSHMGKSGVEGYVYNFVASFDIIKVSDIEYIHKYSMKNTILYKHRDTLSKRWSY